VLSHRAGFWSVATAFWAAMACSSLPTPLYPIYQARDRFGSATVSLVFTVYALGVVVAVLCAGHVSDWLGRRSVLIAALLLEALSCIVFLLAPSLPGLLAGRVLCGLAVGVVGATATAFLAELDDRARGERSRGGKNVAVAANLGGIGSGPLLAGAIAQLGLAPLRVPYALFLGALLLCAAAVARTEETRSRAVPRPRYRVQRIAVPDGARRRYFAACGGAFVSLAVLSLFTSLAPSFLADTLHQRSHLLAGATAFVALTAAAVAQVAPVRRSAVGSLGVAVGLLPLGLAGVVLATLEPTLALFLAGGAVAGAGAGLLFQGSVAVASDLAQPGKLAEALAGIFLCAYLGVALPIVGLGVAAQLTSPASALLAFAAVLLALVGLVARSLMRTT
jgi:MFS family permease